MGGAGAALMPTHIFRDIGTKILVSCKVNLNMILYGQNFFF